MYDLIRRLRLPLVALLLTATVLALLVQPAPSHAQTRSLKVIGYFPYYNIYDKETPYLVTNIPGDKLTHINYAWLDVSAAGQCVSADNWADTGFRYEGDKTNERLRGNFKQLGLLKGRYPKLQVILSVGGWEYSKNLSTAAADEQSRARFAKSCITLMRQYNFDGLDLDWRYPVAGGKTGNLNKAEDFENYPLLLKAIRTQLDAQGERDKRQYSLSISAPPTEVFYKHFSLDDIQAQVDWITLVGFNFEGTWSDRARPQAPLYGSPRDPRGEPTAAEFSIDGAVKAYLDQGVPASKLVLGIGFLGQVWRIGTPGDYFGMYAPVEGIPVGTRAGGQLFYRDILPLLSDSSYIRYFDTLTKTPWLFNQERRIVVSYEDEESLAAKSAYVQQMGLGGVNLWELNYDSKSTLISAMYRLLNPANPASAPTPTP